MEGTVFTGVCLSTGGGGGYDLYPSPFPGTYLVPGPFWGCPRPVTVPARSAVIGLASWWGGGGAHPNLELGYPPWQNGGTTNHYTERRRLCSADSMPLAFNHEDFLDILVRTRGNYPTKYMEAAIK